MIPLTDLLRLHEVRNEAEKFLKPCWDLVIDYFILVLVMVAVVVGVVGLSAPGPVCVPVVNCRARGNSSLKKTEICAKVPNRLENREDPVKLTKVVAKLSDKNQYDYINSKCVKNICWMVTLFPNVLIVMAGFCLVGSNAWFALQSPKLEQFTELLKICYKYNPPDTKKYAARESCKSAKMKKFLEDLKTSLNSRSLKDSYFWALYIQTGLVLVIFVLLVWLIAYEINPQYECKIDEIIPDPEFNTFLCSYSIYTFYLVSAKCFLLFIFLHLVFTISKLAWLVCYTDMSGSDLKISKMEHKDLGFLVSLVQLSNPPYLEPFRKTYKDNTQD